MHYLDTIEDGFNTASGKRRCNVKNSKLAFRLYVHKGFNTASGKRRCNKISSKCCKLLRQVSIPQAVSAVATAKLKKRYLRQMWHRFNTASGKRRCNQRSKTIFAVIIMAVSIPQAVSAVATAGSRKPVFKRFQKVVLENLKP